MPDISVDTVGKRPGAHYLEDTDNRPGALSPVSEDTADATSGLVLIFISEDADKRHVARYPLSWRTLISDLVLVTTEDTDRRPGARYHGGQ